MFVCVRRGMLQTLLMFISWPCRRWTGRIGRCLLAGAIVSCCTAHNACEQVHNTCSDCLITVCYLLLLRKNFTSGLSIHMFFSLQLIWALFLYDIP
uniref:Secreted protein n=1 Tax=Rhipicephalus microplus TaxID=6941 RepID=A0A6M2DD97_RHIMP